MEPYKPYVWLDETGGAKRIEIVVKTSVTDYYILSTSNLQVNSQSNTCVLTFSLSATQSSFIANPFTLDDGHGNLLAGYGGETKIIIRTKIGSVLKGTTTVFLNQQHFVSNGCKIYCWLKYYNAAKIEKYIVVTGLNGGLTFNRFAENTAQKKFRIEYTANTGGGNTAEDARVLDNNTSPAYDPSKHDFIEVLIGGSNPSKGTTTDSEADSSGDRIE